MAKWIQEAIKNPGGLHRMLGIEEGEKIPRSLILKNIKKLREKAKKGKLSKRDRLFLKRLVLAKTLKRFSGKKHKVKSRLEGVLS